MAWIESHSTLRHHPKTKRLAKALRVSIPTAVGYLHFLWWWALDYAQDGNLSGFTPEDIAEVILWEGDPQGAVDALVESGFIDRSPKKGSLSIHDWYEYAGRLIDKREKNRKRSQRARDSKKKSENEDAPAAGANGMRDVCVPNANGMRDVCVPNANGMRDVRVPCAATVPTNRTVPTVPTNDDDDGDARARVREACVREDAEDDGGCAREDAEDDGGCACKNPDELFLSYFGFVPTDAERGQCQMILDRCDPEVLEHAFRRACMTGNKNFAYVAGIILNYQDRGVKDMGGVADDDIVHEGLKRRKGAVRR